MLFVIGNENETTVELWKSKKEDHLLKRCNLDLDDEPLNPLQEQNRAAAAKMSVEDIVTGNSFIVLVLICYHFLTGCYLLQESTVEWRMMS